MSTEEEIRPKTENVEADERLDVDEANVWKRPAPESMPGEDLDAERQEREAKKVKVMNDTASRQRGARMFGMLKGTLNRFKEDTRKTASTEASKRRSAVESRLNAKLRAEQEVNEKRLARSKMEKSLRLDVNRKIEEKTMLDNIVCFLSCILCAQLLKLYLQYKKRQTAAVNLAHFLVTSHTSDPSSSATGLASRPPISSSHPLHSSPALNPAPVYYLPHKLTAAQERMIDDQVDAAKSKVSSSVSLVQINTDIVSQAAADREDWNAGEGADREKEIEDLKQKRDQGMEEIEREEREERIIREREQRDREEAEKPAAPAAPVERAVSEAVSTKEDVSMRAATPQAQEGEEAIEY